MRYVVLLAAAVLGACGERSFGPDLSVTGSWRGETSDSLTIHLHLRESGDGSLAGCASFMRLPGTWQIAPLSGEHSGGAIEMESATFEWAFTGTTTTREIDGMSTGFAWIEPVSTSFERQSEGPTCPY